MLGECRGTYCHAGPDQHIISRAAGGGARREALIAKQKNSCLAAEILGEGQSTKRGSPLVLFVT